MLPQAKDNVGLLEINEARNDPALKAAERAEQLTPEFQISNLQICVEIKFFPLDF